MLKPILAALAVAAAVFVGLVALRPSEFKIERSAVIAAPPAAVFGLVNDFRAWKAWDPWAELDPNSKAVFEGPASGTGAVFGWSGNDKVGEGRMTIAESRPNERIRIDIEFSKPMKASNVTEFSFEPDGGGTRVTWSMTGRNDFVGKAFDLVMNMDKTVGASFEKGLAKMKAVAEKAR